MRNARPKDEAKPRCIWVGGGADGEGGEVGEDGGRQGGWGDEGDLDFVHFCRFWCQISPSFDSVIFQNVSQIEIYSLVVLLDSERRNGEQI